jgi:MFS family permease
MKLPSDEQKADTGYVITRGNPARGKLTVLKDALAGDAAISETNRPIPPLQKQGFIIMGLLFFVSALCALDRVAMSVAILPMADEFQYSESTKGAISSIFSLGYMVGLIPSGLLGTFSSPKSTLSYGVMLWSAAQIATPFAAYISFPALYASRFCMGLAEAVAIPTVQTFVARWVRINTIENIVHATAYLLYQPIVFILYVARLHFPSQMFYRYSIFDMAIPGSRESAVASSWIGAFGAAGRKCNG